MAAPVRRFDRFMAEALYGPDGFYTRSRGAGHAGRDFLTSPEVGPLFGAVLARWLDGRWAALDRPDAFRVHEWGSGPGTLRRAVLRAEPECAHALDYEEIEHGAAPPEAGPQVVIANEVLDNMPFRVVRRDPDGWLELGVDGRGEPVWSAASETTQTPSVHPEIRGVLEASVPEGATVPVQDQAADWVQARHAETAPGGAVLVIDYGASTIELSGRDGGWLRTYREHQRGVEPWCDVGDQDITADVAVDQILAVTPGATVATQAAWLRAQGLDDLVAAGRRRWEAAVAAPDLAAIEGRSRVTEAQALTDPDGLGGFVVMEWAVPTTR